MTTPELQRARQAIAEVRERYEIKPSVNGLAFYVFDNHRRKQGLGNQFRIGPFASDECQAWIDLQAARACFESVLPVGDDLVGDMLPGIYGEDYPSAEVSRAVITAAIRHITTGGDDAGK